MNGIYTTEAFEIFDDLVKIDNAKIWADIDEFGTKSTKEKWRAKLELIAREYRMTSRFALMRILHNRACSDAKANGGKGNFADETMFRVEFGGHHVTFRDISAAHCQSLCAAEHRDYLLYLLDIAGPAPQEDPEFHQRIILRAWNSEEAANSLLAEFLAEKIPPDSAQYDKALADIHKQNTRRFAAAFSRTEAMELGHILKFSLMEMQWYLLRVFDIEGGSFRMNRSGDLIDAYGFLAGADCSRVAALKQRYREECAHIGKVDDVRRAWSRTQENSNGLMKQLEIWKKNPDSMDDMFFSWLQQQAPELDLPSHTARRIYRNLAVYAYKCACGKQVAPDEAEGYDKLLNLFESETETEDVRNILYRGNQQDISSEECTEIAKRLYVENKERSETAIKDRTKVWSVLTTRGDGAVTSSYGAVNSSRTRIQSLLRGDEEVEKGDLLYLLWFTLNLSWYNSATDDPDTVSYRVYDLKEVANAMLDAALLPVFYPPHLMEQSMLLSIVHSGKTGEDPAVVYSCVLEYMKESRERDGGAGRHTLAQKIEIVNQYRSGMTMKACAEENHISEKTLSQWQKELISQGHITPKS